ncbi:MAG: hypothetical protein JEY94_15645 [Melioribacteraceae bacterium]|nr:hypothetical protein [Melioribacteraceae bacterium]
MTYKRKNFEPDFSNFEKVLRREKPNRPVLYEFAFNIPLLQRLTENKFTVDENDYMTYFKMLTEASVMMGYDYITVSAWRLNALAFPKGEVDQKKSKSQNEGALIKDIESFEKYPWPDADSYDYSLYEKIGKGLPDGMMMIPNSNGGVLENVTELVGYEQLCYMYMMDAELTKEIFDAVGSRLLRFYENVSKFDKVGAVIANDDWGFKTQTMFPPDMLREYVIPWHKKIADAIHSAGKLSMLHSCGNLKEVMDDIIDDIGYKGKHSYEDEIIPVEEAYKLWGDRIAIIGGLDIDFLTRSTPTEITRRAKALLELTSEKGGYALGSGNSIPEYIPYENFVAMISAVND